MWKTFINIISTQAWIFLFDATLLRTSRENNIFSDILMGFACLLINLSGRRFQRKYKVFRQCLSTELLQIAEVEY